MERCSLWLWKKPGKLREVFLLLCSHPVKLTTLCLFEFNRSIYSLIVVVGCWGWGDEQKSKIRCSNSGHICRFGPSLGPRAWSRRSAAESCQVSPAADDLERPCAERRQWTGFPKSFIVLSFRWPCMTADRMQQVSHSLYVGRCYHCYIYLPY